MKSQITLHRYNHDILYDIPVEFLTFPGGEVHVKIKNIDAWDLVGQSDLFIDARVSDAEGLLSILLLVDVIRQYNRTGRLHLFIPYLPGARQDRPTPLTAKIYADLINQVGFTNVWAVDPHSDVMPALIHNFTSIPAETVFVRPTHVVPSKVTIIVPDQGAAKRVEAVAEAFGYDRLVYARKHRDPVTGHLSHFSIDPIYTPHAIMIDDICDGGGTFLGLADEISQTNQRTMNPLPIIDLWVTHGIFSKGPTVLEGAFRSVTCTDSFPSNRATEDYTVRDFSLTRVKLSSTLQLLVENGEYR